MQEKIKSCWICGGEANSEEHKFKSADIRRHFGKKYSDQNAILFGKDENPLVQLNSYKDKELKFPKVICIDCNNNKTKSHDNAYDVFTKYIRENFDELNSKGYINFFKIFGDNWKEEKRNLYRYYAKHAGCKIVTSNLPHYVQDLSKFILGAKETNSLKLQFKLSLAMKKLNEKNGFSNLSNGPSIFWGKDDNDINFGGWCSYQWISVYWVVSSSLTKDTITTLDIPISLLKIKEIVKYDNPEMDLLTQIEYQDLETIEKQRDYYQYIVDSFIHI